LACPKERSIPFWTTSNTLLTGGSRPQILGRSRLDFLSFRRDRVHEHGDDRHDPGHGRAGCRVAPLDGPTGAYILFPYELASIAGGLIAFPVNHWLVNNHLKHGCMTLPGADGPAPGLGHRSPESQPVDSVNNHGSAGQESQSHSMAGREMAAHGSETHAMSGLTLEGGEHHPSSSAENSPYGPAHDQDTVHAAHEEPDLATHDQGAHAMHSAGREMHADRMQRGHAGHSPAHDHQGMRMCELPVGAPLASIIGTYALLLGAIWLAAQWVPIGFTGSDNAPRTTASVETAVNGHFGAAIPPGLVQNRPWRASVDSDLGGLWDSSPID